MVTESQKNKKSWLKPTLIALVAVAALVLTWVAYKNPQLFRAAITGGEATPPVTSTLYIPTDYYAGSGDSGEVAVKAGIAFTNLKSLDITFNFSSNISILTPQNNLLGKQGDALYNVAATVTQTTNSYRVIYSNLSAGLSPAQNAILFRLPVSLASNLSDGTPVEILNSGTLAVSQDTNNDGTAEPISNPTFSAGRITISATATCLNDCGSYGACNFENRKCDCNPGYDGPSCNRCATGYTGFPNCTLDIFGDLKGVILTLSPDTISLLPAAERLKAFSSVYVIVNPPPQGVDPGIMVVEGAAPFGLSLTGNNKLEQVQDAATIIVSSISDLNNGIVGVNAALVQDMPGVVKLTATSANPDGSLNGITTTAGYITIVPAMDYTLTLLPTSSYKVRVIGEWVYDQLLPVERHETEVKDLSYTDVTWLPQPTNRLNSAALAGGLLEKGDDVGKAPLYIVVKRSEGSPTIRSNQILVEVPAGPVIEYARIVGAAAIEQGSRINLSVKVSDVDKISDIEDIRTSIVRSSLNTYGEISGDNGAVWFTATPFVDQVVVKENVTTAPVETEGGQAPATPAATPAGNNYRIYEIPVEVSRDTNLADGPYKLLIVITDVADHESVAVIPITIGAVLKGDMNNDGFVNLIDLRQSLQFAQNPKLSPTPAQLQAGDFNSDAKITLSDVLSLLNWMNQSKRQL